MIKKIISKNFHIPNSHTLEVARKNGRYSSIDKLFSLKPDDITKMVYDSGLRGKGGGGASTGRKWDLMNPYFDGEVFLAVNSDESEPGTFKDRQILEYDPHLLIEGIINASYTLHVHHAYIYIRGEYIFQAQRLQKAIDEAYKAGILGEKVLGHKYKLDVTLHRGAGAYICGEKTALLESIEGKRGHPRLKPHNKTDPEWLFGSPAVVNNVETIASVPYIVQNGARAYRKFGTEKSPGTMLFGLSGHINKPGIYELQFGESMQEVIEKIGGGVRGGKKLKAVIPGGSSCEILTAEEVKSVTLDYENLWKHGSSLGTGGMIIMDESVCIPKATKNLFEFYHHESCGQCTPCREGTGWINKILAKILRGEGSEKDIDLILDIADTMNGKTICVFAPAVASVAISHIKKFRDEFVEFCR
ncbi:MAG: NADH-quinone oxidoreductase subunit NuoF [Proteobacteria bacterium]|nr:MAG: NADH-quinone oxidoreductase subunit NuoF [Pseudomonadota bacterium]